MVVAVDSDGVTPEPVTMFGVTVPDHRIGDAPPPDLPVEKYDAVPEPPVPAGKLIAATGAACVGLVPLIAQPPDVRATLVRA